MLGYQNLSCAGKAHGQKGKQMQDITSDGYGRHAGAADHLSNYYHIHKIINCLQGVGHEEGKCELQKQHYDTALRHIPDHGFVLIT